jgi:hypothetical protein
MLEIGATRRRRHPIVVTAVALGIGLSALLGVGAVAGSAASTARAPSPFDLVSEGSHSPAAPADTFPFGYRHEGSYAASAPFCSAGASADLEYGFDGSWITGLRRFTCDDGSGSVTARTWLLYGDDRLGSEGAWQIVEGTGRFTELRGIGAYASVALGDVGEDGHAPSYLETWSGRIAFDARAPSVAVVHASASRLRSARREYRVRVELSARDDVAENPVSFMLTARGRFLLAAKYGTTSTGRASVSLPVRPERAMQMIRLKIEVCDPVGNVASVSLPLRLPG